jgi:hypothetical protein
MGRRLDRWGPLAPGGRGAPHPLGTPSAAGDGVMFDDIKVGDTVVVRKVGYGVHQNIGIVERVTAHQFVVGQYRFRKVDGRTIPRSYVCAIPATSELIVKLETLKTNNTLAREIRQMTGSILHKLDNTPMANPASADHLQTIYDAMLHAMSTIKRVL